MGGVRVWRVWEAVVKDVCIYRMSLSQSSGWKCFTVKCDRQEYKCLHHLVQFICWPIFCLLLYMVTIETDPRLPSLHGNNTPTALSAPHMSHSTGRR